MKFHFNMLIKNPTIENFTPIIRWEEIEYVLGKRRYKKFCKWMDGQTCVEGGVFMWDLDRFLKGLPVID